MGISLALIRYLYSQQHVHGIVHRFVNWTTYYIEETRSYLMTEIAFFR